MISRDRPADVRMMNRAHSPKIQYCSEVVGRRQKSMHFPATNKFLMTVPRRGTTHPEIEYLRLVALPWRDCASANGDIGIAYPFSFANLVEGQLRENRRTPVCIWRSHTEHSTLFILRLGKLSNSRSKFDVTFSSQWSATYPPRLIAEISKGIRITDLATKRYVNVSTGSSQTLAKRSRQDGSERRMNKTSSIRLAITAKVRLWPIHLKAP